MQQIEATNFHHEVTKDTKIRKKKFSENFAIFVSFVVRIFFIIIASLLSLGPASHAQDKKLPAMTIAYSAISGSFAPLWFAHDQGLFAKQGVDAKIAYIQGNRVMLSALTAGEIQAYQGGAEGLIRLVSGGGDGVFIATQYNQVNHYVLITDPSIARIEDLRGKRLALDPTSPTYGYMLKVLEKFGIRKDEVQFVQFGTAGQPERVAAVLRKQATATVLTAPNTYAAEKQGLRSFSAIRDLGIKYPVPMDNDYAIWNAYKNEYWPAHYLIDAQGRIRDQHYGEGKYRETEQMIRELLMEAHQGMLAMGDELVQVAGSGATAAPSASSRSPETYLGYARQENLASPEAISKDAAANYSAPGKLDMNHWALSGRWLVSAESSALQSEGGAISYRFRGRDLHLVLGSHSGKPVLFKVTLDGAAPGADHGADIDAEGNGVIREQRLYQLIRQSGESGVHTFRIEFPDAGAEAFAFTFG